MVTVFVMGIEIKIRHVSSTRSRNYKLYLIISRYLIETGRSRNKSNEVDHVICFISTLKAIHYRVDY